MNCINCPYAKDDIDKLSEIYTEDDIDSLYMYIWCNKVGGKIFRYGTCSIADNMYENNKSQAYKKSPKVLHSSRISNSNKHKNKVKKLYSIYKDHYICVATKEEGDKPYYKRVYRSKRSKKIKRASHKAVRRYKKGISKGNYSNKIFSYWNELY